MCLVYACDKEKQGQKSTIRMLMKVDLKYDLAFGTFIDP